MSMTVGEYILSRNIPLLDRKISKATKTLTYAREDNILDLYIIIPKEDGK